MSLLNQMQCLSGHLVELFCWYASWCALCVIDRFDCV